MHKSKAADLQGVPKNRLTFGHSVHTAWAINAHRLFSRCPTLVQSMPSACSQSAHLTGKTIALGYELLGLQPVLEPHAKLQSFKSTQSRI